MKRLLFFLLFCLTGYGQFSGGGSLSSVCSVTNSQSAGFVLTATNNGASCSWQSVGGASVSNQAIANAVYFADGSVSANSITGNPATSYPAYVAGYVIVKVANTNTGATTININSLGAKNVTTRTIAALASGALQVNGTYLLFYDGTQFQLHAEAALTAVNDTNVTATMSGNPSGGQTITMGWASTLARARGGLGNGVAGTGFFRDGNPPTTGELTGPVTTSGGFATTIAAASITNAMHANEAANSIKGNNTGSPAAPSDLTTAQVKTLLAIACGDITNATGFCNMSTTAGGDLSGTYPNPVVAQVNSAVVPLSAVVTGTNASRQLTAASMSGNGTTVVSTTGTQTSTAIVKIDASGNHTASGCTIDASNNLVCPGSITSGNGSGNTAYLDLKGATSGDTGLTVANVAGTQAFLIFPNPTGATTGTFLQLGASTTCPTGVPGTCYTGSWTSPSGSGTVNAGTALRLAWYATSTNAVSDNANITNPSGGILQTGVVGSVQGEFDMAGSTSGTTKITAPSSGGGTWSLQSGSDTLVGRATTDTLTNKTINCANNTCTGITQTIANGTAALGTGAITSGTCATVVTSSATGVATTDNIIADFNADPTATTGYSPTSNGMLTIIKYPTANNVNFKVCNNTASSITPGAITLNWRVVR